MKRKFTERNGWKKIILSSLIVSGMLLSQMFIYDRPLLACEGVVQPGRHIVMEMRDPARIEDLFATVTFEEVVSGGKSIIMESGFTLPSPSSYPLPTKPAYYQIVTKAVYSGDVDVCINYRIIGLIKTAGLRMSHFTDGTWKELKTMVDRKKEMVCGTTPSLSHIVVFEDPRYRYGPILWFQHPIK